jgi:hypothetical protein
MLNNTFNTNTNGHKDLQPYKGTLTINRRTISFYGTTVLLNNVAKFEKYGLKHVYVMSIRAIVFWCILTLIALSYINNWPYGLIGTIICGFMAFRGIQDRFQKRKYGVTIELNSGTRHHFISTDMQGIDIFFHDISRAIENNEPVSVSYNFNSNEIIRNKINIENQEGTMVVGDNAVGTINNN